jgi:pyridinium-3,5-bisthiocarboxylic acid mononucleotide nickel chelatase
MKTLYFDIFSGASGDMILSALIDLGVPIEHLRDELGKLHVPGLSIAVEKQKRSGIDCSHLILDWENRLAHLNHSHTHGHHHHDDHDSFRNPRQILEIIKNAGYPAAIFSRCEKIIRRLAEAEAAVHGVSVDEVHFHEIGAVDTIIDVTGISLCLHYLGVERITFSTLIDGRGTVHTRHGVMPVPVPAVAKLCEGFALAIVDIDSELLTPTGCAVLTALGEQLGSGFRGSIEKTGYGCGDKIFEKSPNALRAFLVKAADTIIAPDDHAWCLESDMDHISGEIMGNAAERLMQAGALDVSWSPVFMKKGRPGYRLTVICDSVNKQALVDLIILHTRTLGVRIQRMERVIAHREAGQAKFLNEEIQEKHCTYKNVSFSKPEYESLSMLAEKTGRPVIELMEDYAKNRIEKS